jgi:AraC-like DNA-binding protein
MDRASVPVHFAAEVLRNSVSRGMDPIALLRRSRISPRLLAEPGARVSVARFADLQTHTMLAMQDEGLGYDPRPRAIGTWSMMCHAVMGSATLGQALSRYSRFFGLFDFGLRPVLVPEGKHAVLRVAGAPGENWSYALYAYELALFNLYRFASWLVEEHLPLVTVSFANPAPAHHAEYGPMFLANPVEFEADFTGLVIHSRLLDKPVVQSEQTLRRFLRHPALALLVQRYRQSSWTARVRGLLGTDLGDMPEFDAVAAKLALHPQTLRRRLAVEGVSFKELKQQMRRDVALHHLGRDGLSISEIAQRTGFSESSAFIRAFKTWTGTTPYTYRKGL